MATVRFPGLIDVHVHLRYLDPHKEDFLTGKSAALAGGFTFVIDMPNNKVPITTFARLQSKMDQAGHYAKYDTGFHFGSLGDNLDEFEKVKDLVYGLKLYLNHTTGDYIIDEPALGKIYKKWHSVTKGSKPILLHAEEDVLGWVARIVEETGQPTHICHVSSKKELQGIIQLKQQGLPITCGVCPHHLFLTKENEAKLGPFGLMKPSLKSQDDVDYLWEHFGDIDVVESDHAPHTKDEKLSDNPPYGVPGLETTLPLLLLAVAQGKITNEDIIEKCHTNPARIFHVPVDDDTYVEVEMTPTVIKNENIKSKCGWTPFDGWEVPGYVSKVVLRGETVYENGEVLAELGSGKTITGSA